jgi:hypothetical protein
MGKHSWCKSSQYVMLNIYAQLLYDREVDQDARVRSNVGLALTYSIKN